jgi:hypothetical protein
VSPTEARAAELEQVYSVGPAHRVYRASPPKCRCRYSCRLRCRCSCSCRDRCRCCCS